MLNYELGDYAKLSGKTGLKSALGHRLDLEIFSRSDYPYEDLEIFFGEKAAPMLAAQLFALNSMSQNPTSGQVFRDMRYYPKIIMNRGYKRYNKFNAPDELMAFKFAEALSHGLELRSYGTYGHVEKPYGRIAKLKGGVQRALLAMEYLPSRILDRACPQPWFGFINAYEDPKFAQIQEVIYVPLEALWTPENWWALFHEVAHIIVDRSPKLLSETDQVIQNFLTYKENYGAWMRFFNELAAEVIGFELGFFGDLDLFIKTLWPYLKKIELTLGDYSSLEVYLFRTFCVEIWHKCFGAVMERQGSPKVTIDNYRDDDFLYKSLINHIRKVEGLIGKLEKRNLAIASFMGIFKEIFPFIKDLYSKIKDIEENQQVKIFHQKAWVEDNNVKNITNHLLEGKVYWGKIEYPEAVLYNILKQKMKIRSKEKKFPFVMAIILTFWNAQLKWLKTMPPTHFRAL